MGDAQAEKTGKRGWLRTILGTVGGLLSGALVMSLTPLVDRAVRPAKPVANFEAVADGLSVTFHNRSSGPSSVEGWWEFGDGSALQPVAPGQEFVTHAYTRPGDYTARLMLRNFVGDENERAAPLHLQTAVPTQAPQIVSLDAIPVSAGSLAPATFRLVGKVQHAQVCVWDLDDKRPLEICTDPDQVQDRTVMFPRPGRYVIKLAAVNGSLHEQKMTTVEVRPAPAGMVTALLSVSDTAVRVDGAERPYTFAASFTDTKQDAVPFTRAVQALPGGTIADVRVSRTGGATLSLQGKNELALDAAALGLAGVRNLRLQRAADRRSVQLSGEMLRPGRGKAPPMVVVPVVLVEEQRRPVQRADVPVTAMLPLPSAIDLPLPPLPARWTEARRQVRLQLRDGDKVLWEGSQLPGNVALTLYNRRCVLTATAGADRVHLELREVRPGTAPVGN
jgi:hypothetical protein